MMHLDLSEAFKIDPNAEAHVRDIYAGEMTPNVRERWCHAAMEATIALGDDWRVRLAMKVVRDLDGKEQRFPVLLVENGNLP